MNVDHINDESALRPQTGRGGLRQPSCPPGRGREMAAQREALGLERRQGRLDGGGTQPRTGRQLARGGRDQGLEPAAHHLDRRLLRRPLPGMARRWHDRRRRHRVRMQGRDQRQALGRHPEADVIGENGHVGGVGGGGSVGGVGGMALAACLAHPSGGGDRRGGLSSLSWHGQQGRPAGFGEAVEERLPARSPPLVGGDERERQQGVMELVGVLRLGPGLLSHPRDGRGVERSQVGSRLRVEPAAHPHRLGAPLLERRVVEEGVRTRGEDLVSQRRRLRHVARHEEQLAALEAPQQPLEAGGVHGLFQAVAQRLGDQRMIGDLALADDVLQAGQLVGEHHRDQVLRVLPQPRRRHAPAGTPARHRQGAAGGPAPAHPEQRRIEHRLDHHLAHAGRMEEVEGIREWEAVGRSQRQDDRVLRRRRLQLEVEGLAEALAQGQPPCPVETAAERRVHHQVHVSRLVEEPLGDQRGARGHRAQRPGGGRQVGDQLHRGGLADSHLVAQPGYGGPGAGAGTGGIGRGLDRWFGRRFGRRLDRRHGRGFGLV